MKIDSIKAGSFRNSKDIHSIIHDYNGAVTLSTLINFDYMGAAEFEWGVLDSSARMFGQRKEYVLHETMFKTIGGVPICLYAKRSEFDEIVKEIGEYIMDKSETKTVSKYFLKEPIFLEYSTIDYFAKSNMKPFNIPNFWWDIKNDFIFFAGAADRQHAFKLVIENYFDKLKELNE